MDRIDKLSSNTGTRLPSVTSPGNGLHANLSSGPLSFPDFGLQHNPHKWDDPSVSHYGVRVEAPFNNEFNQSSQTQSLPSCDSRNEIEVADREKWPMSNSSRTKSQNWDSKVILNDLSFLEEKIHQLQDLVHLIVSQKGQLLGKPDELVTKEQKLITADLMSIIVQLISTTSSLLPSVQQTLNNNSPLIEQLRQLHGITIPSGSIPSSSCVQPQNNEANKLSSQSLLNYLPKSCEMGQKYNMEEHELKDEDDVDDGEDLPSGSYEIIQLEKEEILAPHTHFCTICGKGFKRDANLRMHMRGHGDEYKTLAALAKPQKESGPQPKLIKRYSCPYAGCKRNKDHKKFKLLKTILCVKNHYKRTHCDKSYTCSRCHTKKFSVVADLKTHEKHCGKDKWLCSCGTTFSRKDKLFGHIALFQGHTPAISHEDTKGLADLPDHDDKDSCKEGRMNFSFGLNPSSENGVQNVMDVKRNIDDPSSCFLPLNFESSFGGFNEFTQPQFEVSEGSFSFLVQSGGELSSDNLL